MTDTALPIFTGEYEHTLDDKGRVLVPQPYREALGGVVRIGRGSQGQINIYPQAVWASMVATLRQAKDDRVAVENAHRFILAAVECEIDRQGRLLVPASLRRHANLSAEVIINGNEERLEVWSRAGYEQMSAKFSQQGAPSDDVSVLKRLGLSV